MISVYIHDIARKKQVHTRKGKEASEQLKIITTLATPSILKKEEWEGRPAVVVVVRKVSETARPLSGRVGVAKATTSFHVRKT